MITNGHIIIKSSQSFSFDGNGDPVVNDNISANDPIPCQYTVKRNNTQGKYEDGNFVQSSYEIIIEGNEFDAQIIELYNDRDILLKEYKVQDIQFLDVVNRVKITV